MWRDLEHRTLSKLILDPQTSYFSREQNIADIILHRNGVGIDIEKGKNQRRLRKGTKNIFNLVGKRYQEKIYTRSF